MSQHCTADNLLSAHILANVSVLETEIILNYIKIVAVYCEKQQNTYAYWTVHHCDS